MKDVLLIKGARVNNLKNITVEIPKGKLVVITGLSGSGKSSLAFDTIFAEGQRRYVESLSSYVRQFLELQDKPDVDEIRGLAPTIALDQRGISENPRSTVGTITEIADYLRLLFARVGRPKCFECGIELSRASAEDIVRNLKALITKGQVRIFAPIVRPPPLAPPTRGGEDKSVSPPTRGGGSVAVSPPSMGGDTGEGGTDDLIHRLARAGFEEVRLNGERMPLATLQNMGLPATPFTLEVVLGVFGPKDLEEDPEHVRLQILNALDLGDGTVMAETVQKDANNESTANLRMKHSEIRKFGSDSQFASPHCLFFSKELTCPQCGKTYPAPEPRNFSFNSPHGACAGCSGLGVKSQVVPELVLSNPKLTLAQGAIKPWTRVGANQSAKLELLGAVGGAHGFDLETPVGELPKKARDLMLYGGGDKIYEVRGTKMKFQGVIPELEERYRDTDSDYLRKEIETYMHQVLCTDCQGARLRPEALSTAVAGRNIAQISAMSVEEAIGFLSYRGHPERAKRVEGSRPNGRNAHTREILRSTNVPLRMTELSENEQAIATPVIREILARLNNLERAGIGYLTLDRSSTTLSGGESQRVRLAVQLGTTLSGVIYILDEPTVGLHERDTEMLLEVLRELRDAGNSVIVVEHDSRMMREAQWLIDMGPGAGRQGGEVIAEGTPAALMKNRRSLTGAYLAGRKRIHNPSQPPLTLRGGEKEEPPLKSDASVGLRPCRASEIRGGRGSYERKGNGKALTIRGATAFNLKNVDVKIPLGKFVCVTGVSGSGKSTLILEILAKALAKKFHGAHDPPAPHKDIQGIAHLDKVITVDQGPIGRTPRSNPATYTGIFTVIRDLFTEIPEAKLRGFDAGTFSFNVKGGRCEVCAGEGYMRIPMQFMPETYVVCNECHGARYRSEALEIHYKGKNIGDVLNMSAAEAKEFFKDVPLLHDKLGVLEDVGLGYIRLGQPAPTLSGGEAQRVKLATELSRRATGKTLYILDEPTTGLHFQDIQHLLDVLERLVDKGNSVLVIEHNLDVIKCADFVIDMGPAGGDKGGEVVAQGAPRDICKVKKSYTGQYLKKVIK